MKAKEIKKVVNYVDTYVSDYYAELAEGVYPTLSDYDEAVYDLAEAVGVPENAVREAVEQGLIRYIDSVTVNNPEAHEFNQSYTAVFTTAQEDYQLYYYDANEWGLYDAKYMIIRENWRDEDYITIQAGERHCGRHRYNGTICEYDYENSVLVDEADEIDYDEWADAVLEHHPYAHAMSEPQKDRLREELIEHMREQVFEIKINGQTKIEANACRLLKNYYEQG